MSRALAECRVRTGDHRLYGEDSDWNTVIRDVTHAEVEHEQARSDFEAGFGQLPTEVAIRGIQPKVSTVIYRSSDLHWDPNGVYEVFDETALLTKRIAINTSEKVAWFVTAEETPVRWGATAAPSPKLSITSTCHADEDAGLLYINSSDNDSVHHDLGSRQSRVLRHHGCLRRVTSDDGLSSCPVGATAASRGLGAIMKRRVKGIITQSR